MKNSNKNARFCAIETLTRLERSHHPVKPLLDAVSTQYLLSSADRGLTMNLAYGALRHRQHLDIMVQRLSRTPLQKLDPFIRFALHIGLYQLFFLDRIPESAAVNETVNAVRECALPKRLQGFVNGILREAIRQGRNLALPDPPTDDTGPVTNHPVWLTERWARQFGREEMLRICQTNNEEPLLVLRANTSRIQRDALRALFIENGINAKDGIYAPEALVLPDYQGAITNLPGFREGYFQPQDQAAQLAIHLLGPFIDKGAYLDGCAGLGTKTCHLLQLTRELDTMVTAIEPEPQRQRLFVENVAALSPSREPALQRTTLQEYCRTSRLQFSGVIIDAPCSGTGVTGRHPDIRWNRQPEELARYAQRQLELLDHAAGLVAPRGILVYATCSLEAEENREVVDTFLTDHPEFRLTDCRSQLPETAHGFVEENCFMPRPARDIDGFFAARLMRIG